LKLDGFRVILFFLIEQESIGKRKNMNAVTISSKFQISIPKEVREKEGWNPGQRLAFVPHGKHYVLVPVPTIDEIFGIAKDANPAGYRDREDRY
jgi:AbrB family looped-hinge helix DNA binding protein